MTDLNITVNGKEAKIEIPCCKDEHAETFIGEIVNFNGIDFVEIKTRSCESTYPHGKCTECDMNEDDDSIKYDYDAYGMPDKVECNYIDEDRCKLQCEEKGIIYKRCWYEKEELDDFVKMNPIIDNGNTTTITFTVVK